MRNFIILLVFVAILIPLQAQQEDWRKVNLGRLIRGRPVRPQDMIGHVVVVEYWAIRGQKCRGVMSQLNRFYKRYQKDGVVLIGLHDASAPFESIWTYVYKNKIKFPVYVGDVVGVDIKNIPWLLVFDIEGKMVFSGNVDIGMRKAADLIKNGPHCLIGKRKFKYLRREVSAIRSAYRKSSGLGKISKKLEKAKTAEKTKEEATYLLDKIDGYMKLKRKELKAIRQVEPLSAKLAYQKFIKCFKGLPASKEVYEEYKQMRKCKVFRRACVAQKIWNKLELMRYTLKPAKYGDSLDLDDPKCLKKNIRSLMQMRVLHQLLQKRCPNTFHSRLSTKLASEWMRYLSK